MKHLACSLLIALTHACTTAEGDLFVQPALEGDAGGGASSSGAIGSGGASSCGFWQASFQPPIAAPEIYLGGSEVWGDRVICAVAVKNERARLLEIDFAARSLISVADLSDEPSLVAADPAAYDATTLNINFQNFSFAGAWRIYRLLATPDTLGSMLPALPVSQGGTESIEPQSSISAGDLFTAYRQDQSTALTVIPAAAEPVTTVLDARLPHPTIVRVLANAEGVAVLLRRDGYELEYFDRSGAHRVGERANTLVADMALFGGVLTLVAVTETGLTRRVKSFSGMDLAVTEIPSVTPDLLALRLVGFDATLRMVTLRAEADGDRLDLYELSAEGAVWLGAAPLPPTDPERLRVEASSGKIVVFSRPRDPSQARIDVTVFCE